MFSLFYRLLFYDYRTAYTAVTAFRKPRTCTRGRDRLVNHGSVFRLFYSLLFYDYRTAHTAVTAFRKSRTCTRGRHSLVCYGSVFRLFGKVVLILLTAIASIQRIALFRTGGRDC